MSTKPATITLLRDMGQEVVDIPGLTLILRSPGLADNAVPVGIAPVLIGSSAECDVQTMDPSVSRVHCRLRLTTDGVLLEDLGSKNGLVVSGVRIKTAVLQPGNTVALGSSTLVLDATGGRTVMRLSATPRFGAAVGTSVVMRAMFARLETVADSDIPILLLGESGTGKELLAQAIHDHSARRDHPLVVLDCGAIAPSMIEAELFGHTKGAFTGAVASRAGLLEQAHQGTLFLDEIGELPLELQPRLLRAVEARQIRPVGSSTWHSADVRIIAATNRDLRAMAARGAFRQDLYFRLAGLDVRVPPLRERKEDIPLLVQHFLSAESPPRSGEELPSFALDLLMAYDWPGNVRELRNVLRRLLLLPGEAEAILQGMTGPTAPEDPVTYQRPLREARELALETFERRYLLAALKRHDGRVSDAAKAMEVSRQFAYRLLARYGIRPKDE